MSNSHDRVRESGLPPCGRFRVGRPANVILLVAWWFAASLLGSCGPANLEPVDIYPEDQCASCRMAVSNRAFASEIVYHDGAASKFDDLGCFDTYRRAHADEEYAAIFLVNYETGEWIPYGRSVIVRTGIETPMGSGRVAVAGQDAARRLRERHPPKLASMEEDGCCSGPGK